MPGILLFDQVFLYMLQRSINPVTRRHVGPGGMCAVMLSLYHVLNISQVR